MLKRYIRFFALAVYSLFTKQNRNTDRTFSKKELELTKINNFNFKTLSTFVLQGTCVIDNLILITAYDNDKEKNSKVMIIKNNQVIHETDLNTKSHVGGICFDHNHKIIWITDTKGSISGYNYDDIINKEKAYPKYKKIKVINNHINIYGNNATAYIAYFKNKIYVGNYNKRKLSAIIAYDINSDGNINLEENHIIKGLDFTQGITFTKNNKKVYLVTSSSFILKKSLIKVFEYHDNIRDLGKEKALATFKLNPMLEQISFDKRNNLIVVFESNAIKYKKYHIKNNDIEIYNLKNL